MTRLQTQSCVQPSADGLGRPHFKRQCYFLRVGGGELWKGAVKGLHGQNKTSYTTVMTVVLMDKEWGLCLEPPVFSLGKQLGSAWMWLQLNTWGILISSELPLDSAHGFSVHLPCPVQQRTTHTFAAVPVG